MPKYLQTPAAASIVGFHAFVMLGAGWFASYLPDAISDRALIAIIAGPIIFFWTMFWLDKRLPVQQTIEYGASVAVAGSLLIFLLIKAIAPTTSAVISIALIGSHTYSATQTSIVYATAVIFYVFVTYALSVALVTSMELLGHKLQRRVPIVSAHALEPEVVATTEKSRFLFNQSNLFLSQRGGMIIALCLMAIFMTAYISAILV